MNNGNNNGNDNGSDNIGDENGNKNGMGQRVDRRKLEPGKLFNHLAPYLTLYHNH